MVEVTKVVSVLRADINTEGSIDYQAYKEYVSRNSGSAM